MDIKKASFTVEASLLMPFILGILILVCMAATWLGDRDIAYFNAVSITDYALEMINSGNGADSGDIEKYAEENKDNALVGVVDVSQSVEYTLMQIKTEIRGHTVLPFMRWMEKIGWKSSEDIVAQSRVISVRPVEAIRKYRLVE